MNLSIEELGILLLKTLLLVISIFIIFKILFLGKNAFDSVLPKLPKPVLYILIVVFVAIWVILKLINFSFI
ncbi:hypothetical protein SAMN06265376_10686 [Dokdonia pacifica]|uniref:Uncharacterized protein n=1 Tax=Dokdonia pacifica TaxID=1627892 RepID=A0A239BCW9_9FLAO|nr:hypothetical protein SAMN06265376_10686 [Dokdonia pacifica]